jgi:hypothetical protein
MMFALTNKPDMGARLYSGLIELATDGQRGTDIMKVIQHMAGVLTETYLVFDNPDEAMEASFQQLSELLGCEPAQGPLAPDALPPAHVIDFETERGRGAARVFFEEWLDCEYEFHNLIIGIIHNVLARWEEDGLSRAESFRLLVECAKRCMAFELAAQELCDIVLDRKIILQGWSLGDCIASLSAVAGRRVALALDAAGETEFTGRNMPAHLDCVVHVMTQEATRLGVPAGSDWRFGLPANDMPANAPLDLITGMEPYCRSFFRAIRLESPFEQAVSCAKAAGRMVAVASGGELPELEPAIAKPLAMAAIIETYKSVCVDYARMSL